MGAPFLRSPPRKEATSTPRMVIIYVCQMEGSNYDEYVCASKVIRRGKRFCLEA